MSVVRVVVYHTTNCAFCKVEMQWLDSKGIEYRHYNIDENPAAKYNLEKRTGLLSVPVTLVDDKIIRGFDRKALTEALGI